MARENAGNLPKMSWDGMNTIPDNVMLRIIAVSKNYESKGFQVREVRTHIKNYFAHMSVNWANLVKRSRSQNINLKLEAQNQFSTYPGIAKNVRHMLIEIDHLLEQNSKRFFPK